MFKELVRNATKDGYVAEDVHQRYAKRRTQSEPHGKYDKIIAVIVKKIAFNRVS
jgi:hypothetical protein